MSVDAALAKRLLAALPDIPRWVETRSPLLHRDCELLGLREEPLSFVVVDRASLLASVAGEPPAEALREAAEMVGPEGVLLGPEESKAYLESVLPKWRSEIGKLHLLADEGALQKAATPPPEETDAPPPDVRVINSAQLAAMGNIPDALRGELNRALLRWLVVAAYTGQGEPASFCYAGAPTESLWSVAIETLESYRRSGFAAQAVRYLVDLMWERRKRPIWAAVESNTASLALAKKLGFRPVDQQVVMHPPD